MRTIFFFSGWCLRRVGHVPSDMTQKGHLIQTVRIGRVKERAVEGVGEETSASGHWW